MTPGCLSCSEDAITLIEGYQLLEPDAPLSQTRSAFKCPVAEACLAQNLTLTTSSGSDRLNATSCRHGHTGALCSSCLEGWKVGPLGICEECSPSTSGAINPLFLAPVGIVVAYVGASTHS